MGRPEPGAGKRQCSSDPDQLPATAMLGFTIIELCELRAHRPWACARGPRSCVDPAVPTSSVARRIPVPLGLPQAQVQDCTWIGPDWSTSSRRRETANRKIALPSTTTRRRNIVLRRRFESRAMKGAAAPERAEAGSSPWCQPSGSSQRRLIIRAGVPSEDVGRPL